MITCLHKFKFYTSLKITSVKTTEVKLQSQWTYFTHEGFQGFQGFQEGS